MCIDVWYYVCMRINDTICLYVHLYLLAYSYIKITKIAATINIITISVLTIDIAILITSVYNIVNVIVFV